MSSGHGGNLAEAELHFGRPRTEFIDFSANLNGYALPIDPKAWLSWLGDVHHYPSGIKDLCQRLADCHRVPHEQIIPCAGAIEALWLAARNFTGGVARIPHPTFGGYEPAARAAGMQIERQIVPLGSNRLETIEHHLQPGETVFYCNPNNPCASWTPCEELMTAIRAHPKVNWVVDEAFVEFVASANGGLLSIADLPQNLIVIRSLTKSWCIPGLRLGFAVTANAKWQAALRAQQHPWSINSVLLSWAQHFLTPANYRCIRDGLRHLPDIRRGFVHELAGVPGCEPFPGNANYVLVRLREPMPAAGELCECMGRMGFLIRNADNFIGLEEGAYVRLAVRAPDENRRLVEALRTLVEQ